MNNIHIIIIIWPSTISCTTNCHITLLGGEERRTECVSNGAVRAFNPLPTQNVQREEINLINQEIIYILGSDMEKVPVEMAIGIQSTVW